MANICGHCGKPAATCGHHGKGAARVEVPDEIWLRPIDGGTDNECWVVCNKVDAGAVPFVPA